MWDRPRWIAMSPWAFAFSSDNYTDPPGPPREPLPVTHFCRKLTTPQGSTTPPKSCSQRRQQGH